jgi:hypothetical protein
MEEQYKTVQKTTKFVNPRVKRPSIPEVKLAQVIERPIMKSSEVQTDDPIISYKVPEPSKITKPDD